MKKLNNKGFSLVELIIVIAIMVILVVVIAPQYTKFVHNSRISGDVQTAQALATAVDVAVAEGSAPFKTGGTDLDYTKVNGVSELPKSKFSNGTFSFTGDNSDGMKTIWVTIADGDYAGKYQVYPNPDASDGMNAIKR